MNELLKIILLVSILTILFVMNRWLGVFATGLSMIIIFGIGYSHYRRYSDILELVGLLLFFMGGFKLVSLAKKGL